MHGAVAVPDRPALGDRLLQVARRQGLAQSPSGPERRGVVGLPVRFGPAHPETVPAGIDQAWIDRPELFDTEAEPLEDRRQVVREEHVGLADEAEHHLASGRRLEIQPDAALAAVGQLHGRVDSGATHPLRDQAAIPVARDGVLDLRHLGAPIGQECAGHGYEHPTGQLHHPYTAEQLGTVLLGQRRPGAPVGSAGVNRKRRSALPRRILYCDSCGSASTSFFATLMQSGQVVSLCG